MGMRIGGASAAWSSYQTNAASSSGSSSVSGLQQRKQNVNSLFSALQSGDLAAAQSAFATLQNSGLPANSPLNAIGQSLQKGDLASAQQSAQSMQAAHGHHHHGSGGSLPQALMNSVGSTTGTSASATTDPTASTDPLQAFSAFMQNLESALEQQNPTPASNSTSVASTSNAAPSTQSVLWSNSTGFNTGTSNATLKSDLDSLIQELQTATSTDSTSTASTAASASGSTSASTATSTASALQSSFSNLMGSLTGTQGSSASVMNFLQGLDNSLASTGSQLNVSA